MYNPGFLVCMLHDFCLTSLSKHLPARLVRSPHPKRERTEQRNPGLREEQTLRAQGHSFVVEECWEANGSLAGTLDFNFEVTPF